MVDNKLCEGILSLLYCSIKAELLLRAFCLEEKQYLVPGLQKPKMGDHVVSIDIKVDAVCMNT